MVEKKIKADKKVKTDDVNHPHEHAHDDSHTHDHEHSHEHEHVHTDHSQEHVAKPSSGSSLQEGDFVEIDYSGWLKDNNSLFDTTDKSLAEGAGIHKDTIAYGPIIIKLGRNQILKGIDEALKGKSIGETIKLEFDPEHAFGKKDAKLVQLVATRKFTKEGIQPYPGLTVNIDGMNGLIRTTSGGRTIVDFNHPLASKDVRYEVKVLRKVTDHDEQIKAYLDMQMNLQAEVKTEGGKTTVKTKQDVPKELHELLTKAIKENISDSLNIEFQKL
jgi:FKBP-type peptidyl-prolyl cis-trans isomerase SlyD